MQSNRIEISRTQSSNVHLYCITFPYDREPKDSAVYITPDKYVSWYIFSCSLFCSVLESFFFFLMYSALCITPHHTTPHYAYCHTKEFVVVHLWCIPFYGLLHCKDFANNCLHQLWEFNCLLHMIMGQKNDLNPEEMAVIVKNLHVVKSVIKIVKMSVGNH